MLLKTALELLLMLGMLTCSSKNLKSKSQSKTVVFVKTELLLSFINYSWILNKETKPHLLPLIDRKALTCVSLVLTL